MRVQGILFLFGLGGACIATFTDTCSSLRLEDHVLFAKCQRSDHSYRFAPLNLNSCLGYQNGTIQKG
ncbi:uncharacterized protein BDW43DRAFT_294625 [Aspergillus alliaceus]|nr:uncharacterized protein BDW43DRAFT_294625 [Aspergillus alliaceus]KAB8227265.1 hypothetical protein BDW43DRAFT_294625 [Aspergillus alliaceus]